MNEYKELGYNILSENIRQNIINIRDHGAIHM